MKLEELAFVNQQLAGMINSGMPLEGALREVCTGMAKGGVKEELSALEADLAKGKPLADALGPRKLPDFYKSMLEVGAKAGDLPSILNLLADHYSRMSATWERLRALMIYPALVLGLAFLLSLAMGVIMTGFRKMLEPDLENWGSYHHSGYSAWNMLFYIWAPAVVLLVVVVLVGVAFKSVSIRNRFEHLLPGVKDTRLYNLASSLTVLLSGGVTLPESLALLERLEGKGILADELGGWRKQIADGKSVVPVGGYFPSTFRWVIGNAADPAAGFKRAAEIYFGEARYKLEMLMHAVLPVCLVVLGCLLASQAWPIMKTLMNLMDWLGDS